MSNDKKTMEDVRNLIVCDSQFGWTGSTTLRLQQMLALQERGWLAEGAENNEFDLTDAGRDVVARALQSAVQPTLADVQPGGRVRLGNVRDRVMGECEQWFDTSDVDMEAATDSIIAAAQPSPGGQGDALPPLPAMGYEVRGTGMGPHDVYYTPAAYTAEQMQDYARAALAAREPVGEPITVEAVAEIFNHPEYGLSIDWLLENGIGELQVGDVLMVSDRAITDQDGSGEVYTAPPAHAVDLEELRLAVCVVNVVGQIDGHDVVRRNSVLDVIDTRRQRLADSQAVGNG